METLQRHLHYNSVDGMNEVRKIAVRFEEKIYNAATSQVLQMLFFFPEVKG